MVTFYVSTGVAIAILIVGGLLYVGDGLSMFSDHKRRKADRANWRNTPYSPQSKKREED